MSSPRLVADIYPGSNGSNPQNLRAVGDTLFFTAFDGSTGRELWKSNGTGSGTNLVKDIIPGFASAFPDELTAVGDTLFFKANGPGSGGELWRSDGTSSGTKMVRDLWPGLISSSASTLTAVGKILFFQAVDGKSGGLWQSDGTSAGTRLVRANLTIASKSYSVGPPFAAAVTPTLNPTLFFSGSDSVSGLELWKSDGTSSGTKLVREIRPGLRGSEPQGLTAVGGTLFFTANDGDTGRELWKSDGTTLGTTRVKDILTGFLAGSPRSSDPQDLTAVGDTLFFSALDDSGGRELWKSDGTSAGTSRVADLVPGSGSSFPRELTAVGDTLFFTANDGNTGSGLWKSDGTAAGTVFVSDLGGSATMISELTAVGQTLFFSRSGSNSGFELWALDDVVPPPPPVLSVAPLSASKAEGSGPAATPFTFRVSRSGSTAEASTAVWSVAGQGAVAANGADFSGGAFPTGTVSFAAGETSQTLTVAVAADTTVEANESFKITLSAPSGATLGAATATGTIVNDDTALLIAPLAAAKGEGRSGITPFAFNVSRTGVLTGRSTAVWSVAGSGANPTDASDFSGATSGTVSFAAGQTSRTLTLNVRGDRLQETDETFTVSLSASTGATLGSATVAGTIFNDDLIGDAAANTLVGTARAEFLDGGANVDTLTGGAAADVFGFRFGESPLSGPDRITDFAFGTDKIDLFSPAGADLPAPVSFSRAANSSATTLGALAAAVFADANGARSGNQALAANSAALVRATNAAIAGTYLLINNGVAARSESDDVVILLSGFTGVLPGLGVIAPGLVFV